MHLLVVLNLSAQNIPDKAFSKCQTMQALQNQIENNKVYKNYYNSVYSLPTYKTAKAPPLQPVVVPVAFHFANDVLSCTQQSCLIDEVEDQLRYLNEAFGDNSNNALIQNCPTAYQDSNGNSLVSTGTNISFCYATPPAGNAEGLNPYCDPPITIGAFNGGKFEGTGANGWDGILNIFIIKNDGSGGLGVADGIPGRAIADGVTVFENAFGGIDGTTCNLGNDPTFNLGRTLVHEIGHYLGLFHTFEGECNDEPDSAGPYNVEDTPALESETTGCPTSCKTSCNNSAATANFMDYTDDVCMGLFSKDQALVMNFWANSLFRDSQYDCKYNQTVSNLFSACNSGNCIIKCPSVVTNRINVIEKYCSIAENIVFPNPNANGLSLNADSNGQVFVWTVNNYKQDGGTVVNQPSNLSASACEVVTQIYYLNLECYSTPNSITLKGGTFEVQVYPAPPNDLNTLVAITNQNGCSEPIITPINDCDNYITVTPSPANPSFPIDQIQSGTAKYDVDFIPNPNGPDCCNIQSLDGEILQNGNFELVALGWTEIEEAPPGTPSLSPVGIIGVSAGNPANINGSVDAWFGGFGFNSLSGIEQIIDIPDCNTVSLNFDYKTSNCASADNIIFSVSINNSIVASLNCNDATNGNIVTYGPIDIPISSAGNATIRFEAIEDGEGIPINFTIDNVSVKAKNCPIPPSCEQQITTNYNCTNPNSCDYSLNLNGTVNNNRVFKAENNITSNSVINANVDYLAGEFIRLESGFSVDKNFDFGAKIENCN